MLNPNLKTSPKSLRNNLIQDPWDLPNPSSIVSPSAIESVRVQKHRLPIISPAGDPDALPIAPGKPYSEQILLWDWLKLKTTQAEQLRLQFQQTLGLLYWLDRFNISCS